MLILSTPFSVIIFNAGAGGLSLALAMSASTAARLGVLLQLIALG